MRKLFKKFYLFNQLFSSFILGAKLKLFVCTIFQ